MTRISLDQALQPLGRSQILLCAACMGLLVSNMYLFQPLTPFIALEMGWTISQANILIPACQFGVALGLLLIVPLGDRIASRYLVLAMMGLIVVSLLCIAIWTDWISLVIASFILGIGLCGGQIMSPFITSLSHPEQRGRTFGTLIAGGMVAVTLSRPLASFFASLGNWQIVFFVSAFCMTMATIVCIKILPLVHPNPRERYAEFVKNQVSLWFSVPLLRHRAICQGLLFAALSAFWSITPVLLVSDVIGLSQNQLGLFTLIAISAAIAAPLAGWLKDHGLFKKGLWGALVLALLASFLALLGLTQSPIWIMGCLLLAAACLDFAVTLHLVLSQQAVFEFLPTSRSRLNSLFMGVFFMGGALGSWGCMALFSNYGLTLAYGLILLLCLSALILHHYWSEPEVLVRQS